jgi:hypothetical protein
MEGTPAKRQEKSMNHSFKKHAWAILLALIFCLSASGCFDYEVELALKRDGKGSIAVSLILPKHLASESGKRSLNTLLFPIPQTSAQEKGSRYILKEFSQFDWLDVVLARRIKFKVQETDSVLLGMASSTFEITARLESAEGDLPDREVRPGTELETKPQKAAPTDPAEAKARRLLAASLVGHHLKVSFAVPGRVTKGKPLVLGASRVDAIISPGKDRVAWKVPLSVLVIENIRHTLVFQAQFKGRLEFKLPGQTIAFSRYPTPEEERRVEQERKSMGK